MEIAHIKSDLTPSGNIINFIVNQPLSRNSNIPYLISPKKFIAIKPDELVISDDGIFYYKNGDDFSFSNEDRVVIFDITTKQLTAYSFDMTSIIKFARDEKSAIDFNIYGCNGTVIPAATCKYKE